MARGYAYYRRKFRLAIRAKLYERRNSIIDRRIRIIYRMWDQWIDDGYNSPPLRIVLHRSGCLNRCVKRMKALKK